MHSSFEGFDVLPFLFDLTHGHCVFESPIFKAFLNSQADKHI